MDDSQQFAHLMTALRAGEPWAAEELCREYTPFLRAVVRRHLNPALRAWFDSLDFVQELWVSFLASPRDRYTFDTPAALYGFLSQVVLNKVTEVWRDRFRSEKHDIGREQRLGTGDEADAAGEQLRSPDPTPSHLAIAAEEWERLLGRFPAGQRLVLTRLREGHSYEDIAKMTGVSLSTVNRVVKRLKEITGL